MFIFSLFGDLWLTEKSTVEIFPHSQMYSSGKPFRTSKLCWFHCKGKSPGSRLHVMCLGQQLTRSAKWTSPGSGSWATTLLLLSHKPTGQACCLDGKFVLPLHEATKSDFLKWLSGFLKNFRDDLTSRESWKNFGGPPFGQASTVPGDRRKWMVGLPTRQRYKVVV